MASSTIHPRRRPASPSVDELSDSLSNISLRKGSTFHPNYRNKEPTIFGEFQDLKIPSLISRSTTCPKSLDDLLIGSGERRAVDLIKKLDDAIANRTQLSDVFNEPGVLPVPRFMVEHAAPAQDKTTIKQESPAEIEAHHHRSDSGIGSSIAESTYEKLQALRTCKYNSKMAYLYSLVDQPNLADDTSAQPVASAITRSFSSNVQGDTTGLSAFAEQQIHKFIINPILRESSLKEFYPLIRDLPSRIDTREIKTLRDLEKTLIFLAPVSSSDDLSSRADTYLHSVIQDFSRSPAAYRSFCEASIRCLHLTVDAVHESDQCLPSDRPYNTGYFIDLVEQIRRYATILAATREKQERGEELDEMDATPYVSSRQADTAASIANANTINREDRIELHGGVSHNGKAGFLTVTRDGKNFTNLANNQPVPAEEAAAMSAKRPIETSIDDDGARRSMARRKKDAPILTYYCQHSGCGKKFKRPCDLTKHDKTHDRPFKCPELDCKYHEKGWPTEKECDRHYNDKHSDAPKLYSCEFVDCPYTSKRESNCKQHMEKSHGWNYTRSKNNGRGLSKGKRKAKASSSRVAQAFTPSNFGSDVSTPLTSIEPSPLTTTSSDMAPNEIVLSSNEQIMNNSQPLFNFGEDFVGHFNTDFFGEGVPALTPAWTNDHVISAGSSAHQSPFEEHFEANFDMGNEFQQLTPSSSNHDLKDYTTHAHPDSAFLSGTNPPRNTFSPNAGDLMLTENHFQDSMQIDEGFGSSAFAPTGDFALFEGTNYNSVPLFTEEQSGFGNMGSQFGPQYGNGDFDVKSLFPELQDN